MVYALIGGLVWIACGAVAYAALFAHWQRGWPSIAKESYRADRAVSIMLSLSGPAALITALASTGFRHGLKWR